MEKGVGRWCKPDPMRAPLTMLIWRLMGMWGRERNAHLGMNCGYWGKGQMELHSASLEPAEGPLPEGEILHESAQSGKKFEPIDTDFYLLFGLLHLHPPLLVGLPYSEGWCWPSLLSSLSLGVLGRPKMTPLRRPLPGAKRIPELELGRCIRAHSKTLVVPLSVPIFRVPGREAAGIDTGGTSWLLDFYCQLFVPLA